MNDPLAARYSSMPEPATIRTMTADEIGRSLLPTIREFTRPNGMQPHGISARDFARGAGDHRGRGDPAYAELIMEGLAFLERAGLLIENPQQVGSRFLRLSRAGLQAAASEHPALAAAGGQEARTLLHPLVAEAALGHLERGGRFLDDAAFAAFRALEVAVREKSGLSKSAKTLFYAAFKDGEPHGPLIPDEIDPGEAQSLRELMAGAYGFFRNPPAHGHVHNDPAQTMRVLMVASTLMYILETL